MRLSQLHVECAWFVPCDWSPSWPGFCWPVRSFARSGVRGGLLQPFDDHVVVNALFGLVLAAVSSVFETRLRDRRSAACSARDRRRHRPRHRQNHRRRRCFWADTSDPRIVFLHSRRSASFCRTSVWSRGHAKANGSSRPASSRSSADTDRDVITRSSTRASSSTAASRTSARPGFLDGTLVMPQFVLKELQFVADSRRFAQAQPRPARPRHPAEDPEDGRRGRDRSRTSTFPRCAKWI